MKLAAHYERESGLLDYTDAGYADADLSSARMALDRLLARTDLTPAQRRDFKAARTAADRAARAVGRHVDRDAVVPAKTPAHDTVSNVGTAQSTTSGGDHV